MKICFLTHNLKNDNGGGTFSLNLIQGVLAASSDLSAIVLTSVGSENQFEKNILYPNRLKLLLNFRRIRNFIKDSDIVHAMDIYPFGIIAFLASLGLKKRMIITAIGTGSVNYLNKGFLWLKICSFICRKADFLTAISEFTKKEILKKIPNLQIEVINPGIDFKKYQKEFKIFPPAEKARPYILSVGSLRWRKGYKLSIKAFAEISSQFPNLNYLIVGKKYSDKYYNELQKQIDDFGMREKIILLDNINNENDLISLYKNAELFCLLSQNINYDIEGFGIVFLEAAACGLPVVGSSDCGVEDAVLKGLNGILVGHKDYKAFGEAIVKILSDKELKRKMSLESSKFANEFEWIHKILQYIELYKKTLSLGISK